MDKPIPAFLLIEEIKSKTTGKGRKQKLPFIDRTLKNIAGFIQMGYLQHEVNEKKGTLQTIDAWAKMIFAAGFIIVISFNQSIRSQLLFMGFLFLLYTVSSVNLLKVYTQIAILGFIFGLLLILPASLNIFTPGKIVIPIIQTEAKSDFWIYSFPKTIGITREGCLVVLKFFLKVVNSIGTTLLIIYTTPFPEIIKSLRVFKVPGLLILTITLTYKYLFILSQTTEDVYFALKARWWQKGKRTESNRIIAGRISFIFRKSWLKYEEIYLAMIARGFTGEIKIEQTINITLKDALFLTVGGLISTFGFFI